MHYKDIPGWFMPIDQAAFAWLLAHQSATQPPGGVVELGVFMGKSAVLIGNHLRPEEVFTACDLFQDIATSDEADPEERRFFRDKELTLAAFERIYLTFHKELPRVVRGPTSTITRHVAPGSARFVHVDAGKSYDRVRQDIASAREMLREGGIVALSDYRKTGNPGCMAAVWEAVLTTGLKPFANTDFKLYATWGDPAPYRQAVVAGAGASDWAVAEAPVALRDTEMVYLHRKG